MHVIVSVDLQKKLAYVKEELVQTMISTMAMKFIRIINLNDFKC